MTRKPDRRGGAVLLLAYLLALSAMTPAVRLPPSPVLPNVLLLTIDCLRADRLGCYGYPRPTSPGLDQLAQQGVLFTDCVAQAGWTSPGLTTILTGLYPEVTGVRGRENIPPPGLPALPALFRVAGREIPNLSYLTSLQNFWNLGYEPSKEDLFREAEDRHVVDFLEKPHPRPFFAWYHYRFLHLPYNPPEPWRSQLVRGPWPTDPAAQARLARLSKEVLLERDSVAFTAEERRIISDLYDANVRRMDAYVSSILLALDRTGLTSTTVVAVTADHGEELFERGFVGHASTSFHGTLHEEILHVPLILRAPGILPAGKRVSQLCGQVDVAPTLLELAGVSAPPDAHQGMSLAPLARHEQAAARTALFSSSNMAGYQTALEQETLGFEAVTTPQWRYIRKNGTGGGELYDRAADAQEKKPVERPDIAHEMERLLAAHALACRERAAAFGTKTLAPVSVRAAGPPPRIVSPAGPVLDYQSTHGTIAVVLDSSDPGPFVAQYEIGTGIYRTTGTIELAGRQSRFGPFSRELWNTLALWNPWRFRVARRSAQPQWGEWRAFEVKP